MAVELNALRAELETVKAERDRNAAANESLKESEQHASMWCVRYMGFIEDICEKLRVDLEVTPYRNAALGRIEAMQADLAALRAFAKEVFDICVSHQAATETMGLAIKHGLLDGDKPTERLTG